jgi:hypothetical protein
MSNRPRRYRSGNVKLRLDGEGDVLQAFIVANADKYNTGRIQSAVNLTTGESVDPVTFAGHRLVFEASDGGNSCGVRIRRLQGMTFVELMKYHLPVGAEFIYVEGASTMAIKLVFHNQDMTACIIPYDFNTVFRSAED